MKRISKELADKMVMEVLVTMSKKGDMSSEFARDSMNIMQNEVDNTILTGVLMCKAIPSLFDDNEKDMKATIMGAIQTVFCYAVKNEKFKFNTDLAKEIAILNNDNCASNTKLDFALNQFVNAFFEYERLEKTYPELMKIM
jgi:hypothetical protein